MNELSSKNEKDLMKDLADKRESLRNFRFALSGAKTKNTREGKTLKKDIARILTELRVRLTK